jgi:hypothetical protein
LTEKIGNQPDRVPTEHQLRTVSLRSTAGVNPSPDLTEIPDLNFFGNMSPATTGHRQFKAGADIRILAVTECRTEKVRRNVRN